MADINVSGRMLVKTLKNQFKEEFGSTLRVYKGIKLGANFADDEATLASIREGEDAEKSGELVIQGNMHVKTFEEKFKDIFGVQVQVATPDDSKLAQNDITLAASGK